jgi:hypothetical protein
VARTMRQSESGITVLLAPIKGGDEVDRMPPAMPALRRYRLGPRQDMPQATRPSEWGINVLVRPPDWGDVVDRMNFAMLALGVHRLGDRTSHGADAALIGMRDRCRDCNPRPGHRSEANALDIGGASTVSAQWFKQTCADGAATEMRDSTLVGTLDRQMGTAYAAQGMALPSRSIAPNRLALPG